MRRLLTGGIKAILAIAALSTAAHWAMRVQREPAPDTRAVAALPDPATTGSITPRLASEPVKAAGKDTVTRDLATKDLATRDMASGLDQRHLSELIAGTTPDKPKPKRADTAKR